MPRLSRGGTLALGANGGKGIVDVESATGATLDGVQLNAFNATDSIEVGLRRRVRRCC